MARRALALAAAGILLQDPAAAGPCGRLGDLSVCAEAGAECAVIATAPDGSTARYPVLLPHPERCGLIGRQALFVVPVCGRLPAALVASAVPLTELGEALGGGFTHRQVEALVLVDRAGALRIGTVVPGAATRGAALHAPDPKHLQIAALVQGFCDTAR